MFVPVGKELGQTLPLMRMSAHPCSLLLQRLCNSSWKLVSGQTFVVSTVSTSETIDPNRNCSTHGAHYQYVFLWMTI